ncbi:P-loop containing nucleoside triphosphate hydrolases superfamily protein [Wolffia australiana]
MAIGAQSLVLPRHLLPFPSSSSDQRSSDSFSTRRSLSISCKTSSSSSSSSSILPDVEPEGRGAAAPTRGDRFLERQHAKSAAEQALKKEAAGRKKTKKTSAVAVDSSSVTCCYGCGSPLQKIEADAPGYVDPETYDLKERHRQLKTVICQRCHLLSHGHMITAVGGVGGYSGGKQFVTAEELRERLSHLRKEKALIVKLVDIVDFNGSFLSRIRDLIGSNPIIMVVTKVDLLPKGTDMNCIGDWVVEATMKKKLNVISVHLTSSKSLVGIAGVISEVQKEKKGRDVYILGSANVGKSAFINAMLKMMSYKDPVAAAARKYKPVQSAVPGTTLGPIEIEAFHGGGKIFDMPGVHLHHRQAAVVQAEDLPLLAPRSYLRGQTFPTSRGDVAAAAGLTGFSLFWGGLIRIDILQAPPQARLTFYGPRALKVNMVPIAEADDFYQRGVGSVLTPPTGGGVDSWQGLQSERCLQIRYAGAERPACDVAISGLGWVTVEGVEEGEMKMAVWVAKPVEVFTRAPMPVGGAGREWYEFRDMTEEEEESRPRWYF